MVCYNVVYLLHCHAITTFIPYNLVRKSVNMCEKLDWAGEVSTRRVVFVGPRQLNKTYWVNILRSTPGISQTFYPALSVEMFELQCGLVTGPRQICAEEILSTQPNNGWLEPFLCGQSRMRFFNPHQSARVTFSYCKQPRNLKNYFNVHMNNILHSIVYMKPLSNIILLWLKTRKSSIMKTCLIIIAVLHPPQSSLQLAISSPSLLLIMRQCAQNIQHSIFIWVEISVFSGKNYGLPLMSLYRQ